MWMYAKSTLPIVWENFPWLQWMQLLISNPLSLNPFPLSISLDLTHTSHALARKALEIYLQHIIGPFLSWLLCKRGKRFG